MKKLLLTIALIGMAPSLVAYPWQRKEVKQEILPPSSFLSVGVFFSTLAAMGAACAVYTWYKRTSDDGEGGSMRRVLTADQRDLADNLTHAINNVRNRATWERGLERMFSGRVPKETVSALQRLWDTKRLAPQARSRRLSIAIAGLPDLTDFDLSAFEESGD